MLRGSPPSITAYKSIRVLEIIDSSEILKFNLKAVQRNKGMFRDDGIGAK
jgi:hypothetical protein